jgi:hypothetical protein
MFATWIINRQRPFSIIEDPELVEIIQYLNPKAQLVKADATKNRIVSLYDLGKRELKASIIIIILGCSQASLLM